MNLLPVLRQRYFDANGNPLAGGKLYSYQSGTTTPQNTYTDSVGGTPNANPVILDANGEANVWADPSLSYKFVLKTSADVVQWTVDNVIGLATNNSVVTASLQDGAVTTPKLADDSVTAAKLADSVATDSDRAVTTNHIRDGAVTTAKIADAGVTVAKLSTVVRDTFAQGSPRNLSLTASVATSALTIAIKGVDGSDPSAASPVYVTFRSSTSASGVPLIRSAVAATSFVVSSGSTLGHVSGVDHYIYVYAIDNAGTVELAVSSSIFDEGTLVSTVAEGGGGAADSGATMYSTAARTNLACRLIGRMKSNQAAAGAWGVSPTEISLAPFRILKPYAFYRTTAADSIVTATIMNYVTKTKDTRESVTTGGSWKFTAPESGAYNVSAVLRLGANTLGATQAIRLYIYKNGASLIVGPAVYGNGSSISASCGVSGTIDMAAGDYVDIRGDGASTALDGNAGNNWVTISKVIDL